MLLEVDAAYNLAAALSNYDKEDIRNLRFLEIQVKQTNKQSKNNKDFINLNRQKLAALQPGPKEGEEGNASQLTSARNQ